MQVLTLDPRGLDRHALQLSRIVKEGESGSFDAIVAVRRGGSFVCDAFCHYFPKERYGARYDIALQRASTKRKNGPVCLILKRLPLTILNLMRMMESSILSLHRKIKGPSPTPDVEIPGGLAEILKAKEFPKILIIDDAIDSGDTLSAIVETLKDRNRKANIITAVVTETTGKPRMHADYSLYRNKTLIRFPWSNDYKTR